MLKRLWLIFGPVLIAVIAVILVVFVLDINPKFGGYESDKKTAVSVSTKVFKSATIKQDLLNDPDHRFVPFFGSSEWKRFDPFHPAVLAEKYDRDYRPLILGQAGATSLTQYYGMQQMSDGMKNKQAVFFVSPQWFTKKGTNSAEFLNFYTPNQALYFLKNVQMTDADKWAAKRFLEVMPESDLTGFMNKVAKGEKLTDSDKKLIDLQLSLNVKEDAFFSSWRLNDEYKHDVTDNMAKLPAEFNREELGKLATELGTEGSSNNPYGIKNSFYTNRLAHGNTLKRLKGSQKNFNYCNSKEYADFQLILEQFAKDNTDVLFIIPPVNKKWSDYTGLDIDKYNASVDKIKTQLTSQGFNNIADLSKRGSEPFFMQDTIHVGWNGWLALDDAVNSFLSQPIKPFKYHINDKFLSKDWQNYLPYEQDVKDVIK